MVAGNANGHTMAGHASASLGDLSDTQLTNCPPTPTVCMPSRSEPARVSGPDDDGVEFHGGRHGNGRSTRRCCSITQLPQTVLTPTKGLAQLVKATKVPLTSAHGSPLPTRRDSCRLWP